MAVMGGLWVVSPVTALVVFIAFSGWHFGQTDFKAWNIQHDPLAALWGVTVVVALTTSHYAEVTPILASLQIEAPLNAVPMMPVAIGATAMATMLAIYKRSVAWLASIALITASFWTPLLVSFGLYFIGQHSCTAWSHLKAQPRNKGQPLWTKAFPFTFGAVALFGLSYALLGSNLSSHLRLIVIFGSCISMPHILCMHRYYQSAEV